MSVLALDFVANRLAGLGGGACPGGALRPDFYFSFQFDRTFDFEFEFIELDPAGSDSVAADFAGSDLGAESGVWECAG